MADFIFDDWFKKVDDLRDAIGKDLAEIRKAKDEMQSMRSAIFDNIQEGKVISDPTRIVISAPEIIIGNVDVSGAIYPASPISRVVIRSNETQLQSVAGKDKALPGRITLQAPIIRQEAVDTGRDGLEHEVTEHSSIETLARNIVIDSNAGQSAFNLPMPRKLARGVEIRSDSLVLIDSTKSVEKKEKLIKDVLKDLQEDNKSLEKEAADLKAKAKALAKQLQEILSGEDKLNGLIEDDTRTNVTELHNLNEHYHVVAKSFYHIMNDYMYCTSALVESKRQEELLKKQQDEIGKKKDKFKEETTSTAIVMRSETVSMISGDGDGSLRENPESGVMVRSKNVSVINQKYDGSLIDNSQITLSAQNVHVTTANPKRSDPKTIDNSENPAIGKVKITSKDITVEAVDYDVKDRKYEEKALTKEGSIKLRAENIDLAATDTEGKATGKLGLNAKNVDIRATDVKKEKGKPDKDDKLAAGGQLTVSAEKVIMGSKTKDNKTKTMQVAAENVGLFADTTAEMQQGEGKAAITLDGGNASLGGSKVALFGNTTIEGGAEIKGETKSPKVTSDQVEAKSAFKSPNINDTMGAGVPGQPGKISAKLKAEEVKAE